VAVETGDGWLTLPVSEFEALHARVAELEDLLALERLKSGALAALCSERTEQRDGYHALANTVNEEVKRLREAHALAHAALQDAVASTGGALIVQDYGRLNLALLEKPDADK
jgi:hypothetical protein